MPLNGFKSECGLYDSIVTSRDKGSSRRHIAHTNGCCVTQYRIDGYVITQGNKCDYLVMNETDSIAFLIELKGSDLSWAAQQLASTEENLRHIFAKDYEFRFRIVASKCKTQEIESTEFRKYRAKWKGNLKYSTNRIEESIR